MDHTPPVEEARRFSDRGETGPAGRRIQGVQTRAKKHNPAARIARILKPPSGDGPLMANTGAEVVKMSLAVAQQTQMLEDFGRRLTEMHDQLKIQNMNREVDTAKHIRLEGRVEKLEEDHKESKARTWSIWLIVLTGIVMAATSLATTLLSRR